MELRAIAENPPPPGAVASMIATRDRLNLRAARWSCGPVCRGTVAILEGRAEFIEKYFEVVAELLDRSFDVVVLDWRGQGLSERLLRDRRKGHIGGFRAYERDLEALRRGVLEPFCRPPWFAIGHSMGGAILLAQARAGRSDFERLVLTSPMIEIHGLRFPRTIRAFIGALSMLGLGRAFAPGGGGDPYMNRGFRGNVLTSDPVRFERIAAVVAAAPELAIGDPTVGWIKAAFRLMQQFKNPEYPRRILTPTLVVAGGADALVDTPATESFAGRLKAGRFITLPGARHEILMERDPFREQFWAAFDAFVPGLGAIRDHHAADSF